MELVKEAFETARYQDKSKIGMNIAASRFEVEGQAQCLRICLGCDNARRSHFLQHYHFIGV